MQVPYGFGSALVACAADDEPVCGLAYTCPPVRLIDQYAELGRRGQRDLASALTELELLAVAEHTRRSGVGTRLLAAVEERASRDGGRLLFAKIRADDRPVLGWYRRRGYRLAADREPVVIDVADAVISFDDGGDGYRLAVKSLDAARQVRRIVAPGGTYLTIMASSPVIPSRPSSAMSYRYGKR
ncbi:GNAT family N-acetyltransferase [Planomonospora sp. ID91781]|nr:GNAT family N-acetyltransferase [Planomonospora sp. ID91781]